MFEAAIFDMDGLLVESESRWRIAEAEACERYGLPLTEEDFDKTTGVRMREITKIWFEWYPWEGPSPDEVAAEVVDRVIELCAQAVPLDGVVEAIELFASRGIRLGLCSSSDMRMIDAIVGTLGLHKYFEVIHSAENDEYGKPHPQPFLETAKLLGVAPADCMALEDSAAGTLSAKSAGMTVISVPEAGSVADPSFGIADLVLQSLTQLDGGMIDALESGLGIPTLSRPRFHLAFSVDDLDAARHFYGTVLGCVEGRSDVRWIDFDLWGHQIVAHLDEKADPSGVATSDVDGHQVPANHFGVVLHVSAWRDLVDRLRAHEVPFYMEPTVRFEGEQGEQHTCFVRDPAGNALEFKAFVTDRAVFWPNVEPESDEKE